MENRGIRFLRAVLVRQHEHLDKIRQPFRGEGGPQVDVDVAEHADLAAALGQRPHRGGCGDRAAQLADRFLVVFPTEQP
ncbi:MAG: hypothetical protein GEU98_16225 [Pseudonocardiaceae bacterium]|nr:hypothetical protein [Pseudonocardiaceae bacterium]